MNRRRGVALVAALGLMALLGILIVGALASSIAARRATWLSQSDAVLSASADDALGGALEQWQEFLLADLPLGAARTFEVGAAAGAPLRASVVVTRLPHDVLWMVADAESRGLDRGRRRFGLVARFAVPGAAPPAGIVARGNVDLSGAVRMSIDSGGDADCAAPRGVADVLVAPGSTWTADDSARVSIDARALDSSTYYLASRQLAWLARAVGVRHVTGDTTIAGGSYQGILLVDGALRVTKPFTMTGVVIAQGPIEASDSLFLTGAALSFAPSPQTSIALAGGAIHYAPCVIARLLRHASPPRPVRERSWSEIF